MNDIAFPINTWPVNTWPDRTWPYISALAPWGFGEIYRLSAALNRNVTWAAAMNRNIAETVTMTRTVSDTYSEVEEL